MPRLKRVRGGWVVLIPALVVIAVGCDLGVATALGSAASPQKSVDTTRLACPARSVSVAMGQQVVPFTGEHAIVIVIANKGQRSCLLEGYPAVVIRTAKHVLPFSYDDGGGPYLLPAAPKLLTLHPGDHASFVVAKYRCDVGELATGTAIDIWLPGVPGDKSLALSGEGVGMLALCRKFKANGPPDPGNTVALSPVELGRYAR
jgi:hypothetical protein